MAKTELEILTEISEKQSTTLTEVKEAKAESLAAKKVAEDLTPKILALEANLITKDATILEIQTEFKEFKAKGGRMRGQEKAPVSIKQLIADSITEKKDVIIASEKGAMIAPIEMKVVGPILSANLTGTGNNYVSYLDWRPGMEPTGQYHFRNLVRTIESETDFVRFPRANTPFGEGSFGRTAEGNTKPQVDRDYTMIDVTLQTMAGYTIVSRQSLRNITFLRSWLPTSLQDQLEDQEDMEFANTLVAAASGSSTTTTGLTGIPEKIIGYISNLMKTKYRANGIVVAPDVWERLLVFQPSRTTTPIATVPYSNPFVVTVNPVSGNVTILGVPVIPVNWLAAGRVIVGDWTKAAIVQSEGLTLRQSDSHASIFTANEIAFLLERVEELAIFRPNAFITAVL